MNYTDYGGSAPQHFQATMEKKGERLSQDLRDTGYEINLQLERG